MKPIKFDLPMNGVKVATLEQLKDNLTPEILESFRSGKLTKWLRVRNLIEQANQIDNLLVNDAKHEMELVKSLYGLFDKKVNDDVLQTALTDYKKLSPSSNNANDDEIEKLKAELAKKELEIEQLKNPVKSEIHIGKFIVRNDGTAFDTTTDLTWCRYLLGQQWLNGNVIGKAERMNWNEAMKAAISFNSKAFAGFNDWRLPSINELENLTIEQGFNPGINKTVFPSKVENCFWSSTHDFASKAWILNSSYGTNLNVKENSHAVRLVRG